MTQAMAAVGLGTSIAGGITSATGAMAQGDAQSKMYNYQAGVARLNKQVQEQNRDFAYAQGAAEAQKYGVSAANRMGQIKSAQGSSGLDVNSGSAVDVREGQRTVDQVDLATIRSNAAKTAYSFEVAGNNSENQARLYEAAGRNAKAAAKINVIGSILGTATSVAGKWQQGQQVGLFGGSAKSTDNPAAFIGGLY